MKRTANVSEFNHFSGFNSSDAGHFPLGLAQKPKESGKSSFPLELALPHLSPNRIPSDFLLRILRPSKLGILPNSFGS